MVTGARRSALASTCVLIAMAAGASPGFAEEAELEPQAASTSTSPTPAKSAPAPVEELVVRARRPDADWAEVPFAISVRTDEDVRQGRTRLTLGESLAAVPGVFVQNRANFAQDARISIRGFGARANFGLRGIRLYVDGIPQTGPDGQGQLDTLSLPSVGRIEVMRGPASTLYGVAAGGVILVETERPGEHPVAEAGVAGGSFGYQTYDAFGSARTEAHDLSVGYAYQSLDGYRDHSQMAGHNGSTRWQWRFAEGMDLTSSLQFVYSPEAQDPGGLTEADAEAMPTQARPLNVTKDAGESVSQVTLGSALRRAWSESHETTVRGYLTWRAFDGRIPVEDDGYIALDRIFGGGSIQHVADHSLFSWPNRVVVGVEGAAQRDDRRRWQNLDGGVRGDLALDQDEDVSSVRVFASDEWSLPGDVGLGVGLSYDRLFYHVENHFSVDGNNQSGDRNFGQVSPMASLGWAADRWANPYARFSTSFEPPTTTEISNTASQGSVDDLDAQRSLSWELGVKGDGALARVPLRYELVGYHVESRDEIVPQQPGGDVYYVNARRTRRSGLEAMLEVEPASGLRGRLAYAFGRSKYVDYVDEGTDLSGNRIPGIPDHVFTFELRYEHESGLWAGWETRFVSDVVANDENTESAASYTVHGLRFGWSGRLPGPFADIGFEPWVGIENLTDTRYIDNVRINAFGGRYYEPAPSLAAQAGLRLTHHFGAGD